MKVKKFIKRLVINKETVADLNDDSMAEVKGGCYKTICPSCVTDFELCSIDICPISLHTRDC